jgi:hypothetical protein
MESFVFYVVRAEMLYGRTRSVDSSVRESAKIGLESKAEE